jgi:hypothetical protein
MRLARCRSAAPIAFVARSISALALAASATTARAQSLSASELAIVSQVVDGTRITVEYSRPRARGRTHLFGTEMPFGHVWTPGANQSTTLAVSKDVSIDGHRVPKGKYSVWMAISAGDWDLVLDHDTTRYHTNPPKPGDNQIRFPVERMHHDFTEVLTRSFPAVNASGMTLVMQWDTVSVPLAITVARSFITADLYSMGRIDRGELIEVIDYCTLEFSPANGHPRSFEVRATDDDLWASGTIAP